MSLEENKAIIRSFYEALNKQDLFPNDESANPNKLEKHRL